MTARLTILASGSSGNATLLEVNGFGLLIDCGLPPRVMTSRLAAIGASWNSVHAVILTHTHGDHWRDATLAHLGNRKIHIYGHSAHFDQLSSSTASFASLPSSHLQPFDEDQSFELTHGLTCRPVWVSHDSDPTFAFRLDFHEGPDMSPAWAVGYASDLGCGSEELVAAFAGVDVLAVEYNHDERMERNSRRPAFLVNRVLGDGGHLSNRQAAALTRAIASRSGPGFPHHLVQLHLSSECNHPNLAESAGRRALAELNPTATIVTARQDAPSRSIPLTRHVNSSLRTQSRAGTVAGRSPLGSLQSRVQPLLPGFDAA